LSGFFDSIILKKCFNPQYALENLLHIEITSNQDTSLFHFNSPERCYASFQWILVLLYFQCSWRHSNA